MTFPVTRCNINQGDSFIIRRLELPRSRVRKVIHPFGIQDCTPHLDKRSYQAAENLTDENHIAFFIAMYLVTQTALMASQAELGVILFLLLFKE